MADHGVGMPPRDWDASTYDRVSAPQEAMGREVLDRLALDGSETVLDAGCGTGRVTAVLAERLPRGRVIAVDGSPAMVEEARARLGPAADVRVADLLELDLSTLPPTQVLTAGFDPLRDEGLALAAAIEKAGVSVERVSFDGQIHGFVRSMAHIPEAFDALDRVSEFLRAQLLG